MQKSYYQQQFGFFGHQMECSIDINLNVEINRKSDKRIKLIDKLIQSAKITDI